jgi:diguanylate cyclase (GGDEF)-like protein
VARSILIVDDSPDIHALLRVRLRDEDVELIQTLDPTQALSLALLHGPDLVLLDVDMPGRSGFDVCQELKTNPHTAPIPIIFLSGKLDQATKVAGLDFGAIDYVTKPFDPVELRARVRSGLRIKSLQDQLLALARIDELTGLWNRAYLNSRLEQELAAARRSQRPLSLVMCDVDHFKRVNDTYGHAAGDVVLRSIAGRIQASLRASDVACRYGGEEFALILPGIDAQGAAVAAERIREAIAATPVDAGAASLQMSVSLGFVDSAMFDASLEPTPGALIEHADAALYAAKRGGRNRVCRSTGPASSTS